MAPDPMRSDDGDDALHAARSLILAEGRNATSYQILNPGFERWLTPADDAVVGFVSTTRGRVAAGGPVSAPESRLDAALLFERETGSTHRDGERVCWFCAIEEFADSLVDAGGHSAILIGAQPVWDPAGWAAKVAAHPSLRAQLRRATNKGVVVDEWSTEKARAHPELERCLDAWLAARALPPLHFLIEPRTLDRLFDRRVFVATRADRVVGFVLLSPITRRNGWLVEQFVRTPDAPNGVAELMLDRAITTLADEGFDYVTLGLAPLSRAHRTRRNERSRRNPPMIRFLLSWLRLHGRRFYNFDGLEAFKAKFRPDEWEPVYAAVNAPRFPITTLYAIAAAFTQGRPVRTIRAALFKAIGAEMRRLLSRIVPRRTAT